MGIDKFKQVSGALQAQKLDRLLDELEQKGQNINQLIDELRSQENGGASVDLLDADLVGTLLNKEERLADDLQRERLVEAQLSRRMQVLESLENQPAWFNYAAAFGGSVVSTLVMHPIDTIKTRNMAATPGDVQVAIEFAAAEEEWSASDAGDEPPVFWEDGPAGEDARMASTAYASTTEPWDEEPGAGGVGAEGGREREGATAVATQVRPAEPEKSVEHHWSVYGVEVSEEDVELAEAALQEVQEEYPEVYGLGGSEMLAKRGIAGLYEGLAGNVLKEAPSSALYLGIYESCKGYLMNTPYISNELVIYLIAGAVGELVGSMVRAPAEAIKSNVQSGVDKTTMAAAERVFTTQDGRENVLRAWSASILRDVPFGSIQLAIFELSKAWILNNPDIDLDVNTLQAEALLGAFGGSIGSFVSTPMDVVTTRIITQTVPEGEEPIAFAGMAKRVWQEGGPTALFRGWRERVVYWAPAIGIFLSCYCSFRQAGIAFFES